MNSNSNVPRWMTFLVVIAALAIIVPAGWRAAQRGSSFTAAYPGTNKVETGLPPYPPPDQPSPSAPAYPPPEVPSPSVPAPTRVPATQDPSIPTLIPPDRTLLYAALTIPPCCDDSNLNYRTPSLTQAALWTQDEMTRYPSTSTPGGPSATPVPLGQYLAPSGEWTTYTDPTYGYVLEYPVNWFIDHESGGTVIHNLSPGLVPKSEVDPASIEINVSLAEDLGIHTSLESYVSDPKRAVPSERLISQESRLLPDGNNTIWQRLTAQMSNGGILRVYLTNGYRVYAFVVFSLNSQYINVVDHIVASFSIP